VKPIWICYTHLKGRQGKGKESLEKSSNYPLSFFVSACKATWQLEEKAKKKTIEIQKPSTIK